MKCYNIELLGMSHIKWPGQEDFWSYDFRVIFAGDDNKIGGVGIIMNKDIGKRVTIVVQYKSRINAIKLYTNTINTFIKQI